MGLDNRLVKKVADYRPDKQRLSELNDVAIVLLSATSGTGKDSIVNYLLSTYPDDYYRVISHTTRAPRANNGVMEQDGNEYHFIDFGQAEHMLDARAYVEANVYNNNVYGTTIAEFLKARDQAKVAITEVEVNGSDDIIRLIPSVKTIFIVPPSFEEWQRRLMNRYGGNKEQYSEDMHGRLEIAKNELQNVLDSDHFYIVVNDTLEHGAEKIRHLAATPNAPMHNPSALETARLMLARLQESV
jgi:guanylate kinase